MNMCIQFMRCACHKIALFLCGDLTRFELVDFYILRCGTGYVAFIAGTRHMGKSSPRTAFRYNELPELGSGDDAT